MNENLRHTKYHQINSIQRKSSQFEKLKRLVNREILDKNKVGVKWNCIRHIEKKKIS